MLQLFQSAISKQINTKTGEFLNTVASLNRQNYSELSLEDQKAFFEQTLEELIALTDAEVLKFAKENGEVLQNHYQVLKQSKFNEQLWNKYTEVAEFCEAVVNIFLTQKINILLKK